MLHLFVCDKEKYEKKVAQTLDVSNGEESLED
jgi:hypothetical protein